MMYNRAYELAKKAHEGQTRWGGEPYITHPEAVAKTFNNDFLKTVAVLHDIVEDTDVTLEEIEKEFGPYVASAVDAVTHRDHEEYYKYIKRVGEAGIQPILVKLADLEHNLSSLSYKRHKNMYEKYKLAEMYLKNIMEE